VFIALFALTARRGAKPPACHSATRANL